MEGIHCNKLHNDKRDILCTSVSLSNTNQQLNCYKPTELEQSLRGIRDAVLRPGEEVELRDSTSFTSAQIFQIEGAH